MLFPSPLPLLLRSKRFCGSQAVSHLCSVVLSNTPGELLPTTLKTDPSTQQDQVFCSPLCPAAIYIVQDPTDLLSLYLASDCLWSTRPISLFSGVTLWLRPLSSFLCVACHGNFPSLSPPTTLTYSSSSICPHRIAELLVLPEILGI